jgi:hypothetical protein
MFILVVHFCGRMSSKSSQNKDTISDNPIFEDYKQLFSLLLSKVATTTADSIKKSPQTNFILSREEYVIRGNQEEYG